jgi:hypothetical protein
MNQDGQDLGYQVSPYHYAAARSLAVAELERLLSAMSMLSPHAPASSLDSLQQRRADGMALDSAFVQSSIVTELNDSDVLTGRGASIDRFPGNVRFRSLIKSKKKAYSDARQPTEKNFVAREVIQAVKDSSGRFLKREGTTSKAVHSDTVWVLMEDAAIVEKVKQALRDCVLDGTQKSKLPPAVKSARPSPCKKKKAPPSRVSHTLPGSTEQAPLGHVRAASPREQNTVDAAVAHAPQLLVPTSTPVSLEEHHSASTENNTNDHQLLARSLLDLRNKMVPPINRPNQTDLAPQPSAILGGGNVWGIDGNNNGAVSSLASQIPLLAPPPAATTTNSLPVPSYLPPSLLLPSASWTANAPGLAWPPSTPAPPNAPHTWREIPDGYLPIFLGPLSNSTTGIPFTSADLDILWRTKVLAETAGDVLCLAKIRAVLHAALHLPLSRLHLTALELHVLGDLLQNGTTVSHGGFGCIFPR